jgi:hypothetical protein
MGRWSLMRQMTSSQVSQKNLSHLLCKHTYNMPWLVPCHAKQCSHQT